MNLIIFGPPGSGKGTYASRLAPMLGLVKISTGDLLRENVKNETNLGKAAKEFMDRGALVPDSITNQILVERLERPDARKGVVFDGYPRTIEQAVFLDSHVKIDTVIKLNVSKEIIVARLSARRFCIKCGEIYNTLFLKPKAEGICDKCGGELIQRDDDNPEVIAERFDVYEKQSTPVLEYYKNKKTIPFVETTTPSVYTPPEEMIEKVLEGLKKLNLK